MEKAKAPKCRSFSWRYNQTFPICVGVDTERNFNELRQEIPRGKSVRPCESFPCN